MTFSRTRPTHARRLEDDALIRKTLVKSDGAEYQESINSFEPGLRKERFERLYKRYRESWISMDAQFKDLCEVYGTTLTRRKNEVPSL